MSQLDNVEYREGVVLNKPVKEGRGSFVNVGLQKEIQVDRHLSAGLRVTVQLKPTVEGMSLPVCYSPRHFSRNLKNEMVCTGGIYVILVASYI